MSLTDCIRQFTNQNDAVGYYAGAGDNDHDGTADRADFNDGNGVDCSGWVWAAYGHCGVNFPLSSTAGYAFMGKARGWIVPTGSAVPGDMVIYDKYGDAFASSGPRGHVGILVSRSGDTWQTSESRGGGLGVGLYQRPGSFWVMTLRIPQAPAQAPWTQAQLDAFFKVLRTIDNARKDQPSMPKQITYDGHSHVFAVDNDGRLRHDFYTGSKWARDYPAEKTNASYRFNPFQTLDVKTKESGQSENPIDVYALGKLGEYVHTFWTGTAWGTEVFA